MAKYYVDHLEFEDSEDVLQIKDAEAIDTITVNDEVVSTVDNAVNITVPTKVSELENDAGYVTMSYTSSTRTIKIS